MAITLTIETGAGVPNANTYVALTTVNAYWVARGGHVIWDDLDDEQRKARIILSFDYLAANPQYRWRGTKKTATQRGPYPRTGASERDGLVIGESAIPWQLPEAQCILAPRATDLLALLPDLDRGGRITSESLSGVYSVSYESGAPIGKLVQSIDGLLSPLLRTAHGELAHPVYESVKVPDVFLSEHYSPDTDDASATDETP